jgi:hypothetical protein
MPVFEVPLQAMSEAVIATSAVMKVESRMVPVSTRARWDCFLLGARSG